MSPILEALSNLPVVGKQQEVGPPPFSEWPKAAGLRLLRLQGLASRPELPAPTPFPGRSALAPPKGGELSRTTFYSSKLFCFQMAWDQSHVTLLQSLHTGAGPAGCLGTLRGLWERLWSFLPAEQCHCGCPLPLVPASVPPPLHLLPALTHDV